MSIIKDLRSLADTQKAALYQRFFKTGIGQYGEGDVFLGITMPKLHSVVAKYKYSVTLDDISALLTSKFHEYRMVALLLLVTKCQKASPGEFKEYFEYYLSHTRYINNWDLVDLSSHKIVGRYLYNNPRKRKLLYRLAESKNMWERRIAMIACAAFITNLKFNEALAVAEILLHDRHDLIHKAVGWMLREVGKRDQQAEENFLIKHYKTMPRTMLRYAIERFPEKKRKLYMS